MILELGRGGQFSSAAMCVEGVMLGRQPRCRILSPRMPQLERAVACGGYVAGVQAVA